MDQKNKAIEILVNSTASIKDNFLKEIIPQSGQDAQGANINLISGAEIAAAVYPDPKWLVPELVPEGGVMLLVGAPKIGKSWLALDIACGLAAGTSVCGIKVPKPVNTLYLALEDVQRRIASRMSIAGFTPTQNALFQFTWPRFDTAGLEALEVAVKQYDIKLIIVDTLQKVRPPVKSRQPLYEADYAAITGLKELVDRLGITAIVLHHTNKSRSDDQLEQVSGTTGLTGAADTIAILKRGREEADGTIYVTSRDFGEISKALKFDSGRWRVLGDADQYNISKERRQILEAIRVLDTEAKPKAIAEYLNKSDSTVKTLLRRMQVNGLVKSINGVYIPLMVDSDTVYTNSVNSVDRVNSVNSVDRVNSVNSVSAVDGFTADENSVNRKPSDNIAVSRGSVYGFTEFTQYIG